MIKVHIVIKSEAYEYSNPLETIVSVHSKEVDANKRVINLTKNNCNHNIEYTYKTYSVE